MKPSIEAVGLSRVYGRGAAARTVLDQLSLRLWPGELTLLIGASGSGKSTLLAALGGLLRPQSGSVTVLHTGIWSLSDADLERFRFRHFGFVFQGFNLFPALTAVEQVALPLKFAGVAPAIAIGRARDALDEMGLSARSKLRPALMSGGEKQRVAIARALVTEPDVLLADEPTSALDSANSEVVIGLLKKIARERHATVLTVTHDPRLSGHADRIVEMRDGVIISDERPKSHKDIA
ncbi:MAG: transporter ATP-binding protein [Hydrocarboniphaga sp.]|nr:ABC transporter ATP-binding protein [Hydrocarboniphaga sp.]MDB5972574.1 transporter ATP-binding protein [Hydrocarboniphaga sp.]